MTENLIHTLGLGLIAVAVTWLLWEFRKPRWPLIVKLSGGQKTVLVIVGAIISVVPVVFFTVTIMPLPKTSSLFFSAMGYGVFAGLSLCMAFTLRTFALCSAGWIQIVSDSSLRLKLSGIEELVQLNPNSVELARLQLPNHFQVVIRTPNREVAFTTTTNLRLEDWENKNVTLGIPENPLLSLGTRKFHKMIRPFLMKAGVPPAPGSA